MIKLKTIQRTAVFSRRLIYEMILNCLIMFLKFSFVYPHLKDMGEVTINWTQSLEEEIENRIAGGTPTSLEKYPFNVKFFNFGGMCGGVIMSSKAVLTAAHCFDYNTNVNEMKIISNSERTYDRSANYHDIWDFMVHENYNRNATFANDVAIIIIHNSLKFGPKVQPVALTDNNDWMNENEDQFVATGWGREKMHYGKDIVPNRQKLMKTHLQYISNENCTAMTQLQLTADMFCLYGNGVRDTCKGDSGSGILWKNQIVGIVSHGKGCGEGPGVYANVYYFNSWIHDTVGRLNRKFCEFHYNKDDLM